MRYYVESAASIPYLVERCYFDAEQGRLKVALDRLRGLDEQFPDDGGLFMRMACCDENTWVKAFRQRRYSSARTASVCERGRLTTRVGSLRQMLRCLLKM